MSHVSLCFFFFGKVAKKVDGESVINRAYPVYLPNSRFPLTSQSNNKKSKRFYSPAVVCCTARLSRHEKTCLRPYHLSDDTAVDTDDTDDTDDSGDTDDTDDTDNTDNTFGIRAGFVLNISGFVLKSLDLMSQWFQSLFSSYYRHCDL